MADVIIRGVTYSGVDTVSIPADGGGTETFLQPSGAISITDNGVVDVTDYASAVVSVSGGGGGPTASDAILLVTAPAGSVVTMTKGADTRVPTMWVSAADPTLETALFVVEAADFDSTAWTVTATDGAITASDTVLITTNKEYEVVLSYAYYFYKNGVSYNNFDPSATFRNSIFTITENATTIGLRATDTGRNGIAWALPFENHGYPKLYAVIDSGTIGTANIPYFGIYIGTGNVYDDTNYSAKSQISTTLPTTVSVDVSNINSGYIAFRLHNSSEIQVSAIYLSD